MEGMIFKTQLLPPSTINNLGGSVSLIMAQREAYQPFNVWWAEQGLVLHTEFRDGNVPAGYEQLRVFQEALDMLPEGVTKVYLRSHTAGYEHNLLRYCGQGENKRCGKSEEAHSIMKEDLAGGKLPSSSFGENAAWWWIMILAFNLNSAMKQLVLQGSWAAKRMKAIRFSLIGLPGRVVDHARGLIIRLVKNHPSLEVLVKARERIMELGCSPSG
jgi:hypothetical protein